MYYLNDLEHSSADIQKFTHARGALHSHHRQGLNSTVTWMLYFQPNFHALASTLRL